jgi:four helix bundle protein
LTARLRRASYSVPAKIVEGDWRKRKSDYLHFLYIARGFLSETQYFIHLARPLDCLSSKEADALGEQTRSTFASLHGLTRAVERETGRLGKVIATVTSLIAIALVRCSSGQLSVVS